MSQNQDFRLLIVDDEQSNRDLLLRRLSKLNYNVTTASSGTEMFQKLDERTYHLILLDVMMPIMSGFEALEQIKLHEKWRDIPVIMQTASNNREDVLRCLELGAADYVTKPYDIHSLKVRIDKFLRKHTMEAGNNFDQVTDESSDSDNLIDMLANSLKEGELKFPMLPTVSLKVAEITRQENVSLSELSSIIEVDPVLSSKLLRIANSSRFRGNRTFSKIEDAINRIGLKETANQALMIAMSGMFESDSPVFNQMLSQLWRHSLATAIIAKAVAHKTKLYDPDQMFTIALLHDIGKLALIMILKEVSQKRHITDERVLQEVLDSLHSQFGVAVLRRWHFSEDYLEVARSHHCEPLTGQPTPAVQIALFANEFSPYIEADFAAGEDIPQDLEPYIKPLGLDAEAVTNIAEFARDEFAAMTATFIESNDTRESPAN